MTINLDRNSSLSQINERKKVLTDLARMRGLGARCVGVASGEVHRRPAAGMEPRIHRYLRHPSSFRAAVAMILHLSYRTAAFGIDYSPWTLTEPMYSVDLPAHPATPGPIPAPRSDPRPGDLRPRDSLRVVVLVRFASGFLAELGRPGTPTSDRPKDIPPDEHEILRGSPKGAPAASTARTQDPDGGRPGQAALWLDRRRTTRFTFPGAPLGCGDSFGRPLTNARDWVHPLEARSTQSDLARIVPLTVSSIERWRSGGRSETGLPDRTAEALHAELLTARRRVYLQSWLAYHG